MIRLLTRNSDEKLLLREFDDVIPAYAILSHTWHEDNSQEVTFDDLKTGTGQDKAGYRKIQFCDEKAAAAGLKFFWIDTCCIDKSCTTEVSEAINSMFRWYQKASRCYVYLSDVSQSCNNPFRPDSWQAEFRGSRWFTRGWTLQELIAPKEVEFFAQDGKLLGDKEALGDLIQEITRIDKRALQGHLLSEFSVKERKSWMKGRSTKKKEDKIYSLFGIFGIYMPLIYGEGEESASRRLDEEIWKVSKGLDIDGYTVQHSVERQPTGEEKWEMVIQSRRRKRLCLNCGQDSHWEHQCGEKCGLYFGHKASNCQFPVRCIGCQRQNHVAEDCPGRADIKEFQRDSRGYLRDTCSLEILEDKYPGFPARDSANYNREGDELFSLDTYEQANLETVLEDRARVKEVHLNWRKSIVDLLELVGLDSCLIARGRLAEILCVRVGPTRSYDQNVALHRAFMKMLVLNKGKIPSKIHKSTSCSKHIR